MLQRSELRRHVLALVFALAARLAHAGAVLGGPPGSTTGASSGPHTSLASPLLAPLNVLLQWLASRPEYVRWGRPLPGLLSYLCCMRAHVLHAALRAAWISYQRLAPNSAFLQCGIACDEILMEAMCCLIRPEDADETEARERAALWLALTNMLRVLPPPDQAVAATSAALPEDWALRAFTPMAAAHRRLTFSLPRPEQVPPPARCMPAGAA